MTGPIHDEKEGNADLKGIFRVYFPSHDSSSEVLWPYWQGQANSFEDALERAYVRLPQPIAAVPRRKPKEGEYVAVLNVSSPENGMAIYTAIQVSHLTFERRTHEEV